jgi:hypothetical protein
MLSLIASGFYCLVVLACITASLTARSYRQAVGHWRTWFILAMLFVLLAGLRVVGAEEWLRATLREELVAGGQYSARRDLQAPLVVTIFVIAGAGSLALLYRATRDLRGRRNMAVLAGTFAALAMLSLIALRLASLHAVDALLYGPVKLNWVIDLGASLVVMLSAIRYIQLVRARP